MQYDDLLEDVKRELLESVALARQAGIPEEKIILDPGIGFGKTSEHNLKLLAGLPALTGLGHPVVVGVSRKSFIGKITGREPGDRLAGSLAAAVWASARGAQIWRVHDVRESAEAARVVSALREETVAWNG